VKGVPDVVCEHPARRFDSRSRKFAEHWLDSVLAGGRLTGAVDHGQRMTENLTVDEQPLLPDEQ
jgi:hypothetical protein